MSERMWGFYLSVEKLVEGLDNSWKAGNTKRIAKYTKQLNMLLED